MSDRGWLKVMSNGELGEARVRAILMERFHVLTRSVDIDGADFLIQLPGSGRFSDELAPRLGIIQAKFAQDDATSHFVPVEYVMDEGHTIKEFFVLVTVGREDKVSNYLLPSSDLINVRRTTRHGKEFYSITAKERRPFRIKKISDMLDKIEEVLKLRTVEQNKKFYQTVLIPDFEFKRSSLDMHWLLPIPNEEGYIPDIIFPIRQTMRAQLYAFDDIVAGISTLLTSRAASECLKAIDTIISDRAFAQNGADEYFSFSPFNLSDTRQKLAGAIAVHETRFNKLTAADQLDRFISTAQMISDELIPFFEKNKRPKLVRIDAHTQAVSNDHARVVIKLASVNLDIIGVSIDLVPSGNYDLVQGRDEVSRSLPLWKYALDHGSAGALRQLHRIQHLLLADLYTLMFPEEAGIQPVLPLFMAE